VEFRNSGRSPRIPETPDSLRGFRKLQTRLQKLQKGSGVDGEARGSREEWKWIGSPLTATKSMGMDYNLFLEKNNEVSCWPKLRHTYR